MTDFIASMAMPRERGRG